MKVLKWTLAFVLAVVAVLLLGGMLLSGQFQVSRSAVVGAAPDKVYALVAEPRRWAEWSVWTRRDPKMAITYTGPANGAGAAWAWTSASEGDGRMSFTAAEPGRRVVYDLVFPDFGTTMKGDLSLAPADGGTRVTWTMSGNMGSNPLLRWMALFADGMVGKDFEGGLSGLKTLAEKP